MVAVINILDSSCIYRVG